MEACCGSRGIAPLILNLDARWGEWSTSLPGRFTSREGNLRYPLNRGMDARF